MIPRHAIASILAAALLAAAPALAEDLTLEQIMADIEWIGTRPENPYWADDGLSIYFDQKIPGSDERRRVRVDLDGKEIAVETGAAKGLRDVRGGAYSSTWAWKAYEREGDVYVKDLASGEIRQLTQTVERESDPFFLTGGRRVAFRRGSLILVRDLSTGLEAELAEIRLEEDPAEKGKPESFLAETQARLFEHVEERQRKKEEERERTNRERLEDSTRVDPPWYLGKDKKLDETSLSPDGHRMILLLSKKLGKDLKKDLMPVWVTDSGYVETREVRPKVGLDDPATSELLLLDLATRQKHAIDLSVLPGIEKDPLAEFKKAAEEKKDENTSEGEKNGKKDEPKKPRAVRVSAVRWNKDGSQAAIQVDALDHKDRWIALVEQDGKLKPLHRQTDPAWISWDRSDMGWLPEGQGLYFLSEETGYAHIILHDGGKARALTSGEFVVSDLVPSRDGSAIFFKANAKNAGIYEIFRVETRNGAVVQLTNLGGENDAVISPDDTRLLVTHATATEPPELYVQLAEPGAPPVRLTRTSSDAFREVAWVAPEFVTVPSSQAKRPIHARFYGAPNNSGEKRPAVLFVHGAGYLQDAHQGWSYYAHEFMFHTLLVQKGYVVLDMDFRGSAGYGRDWRTAIYRQMGTPELADLRDGVEWLVENHDVDPARVGVYGGSYGGFLTLMALFRDPDLFAAGAALRPVTDWAHYNHDYTSRILNTPEVDPEAYKKSSPIEYAEGLAKPLLICAPMLDDNVLFLDSVRLVQRLIELKKENWEIAIYPVEPHGFREPSSWLDEYRRIFKLFESNLK